MMIRRSSMLGCISCVVGLVILGMGCAAHAPPTRQPRDFSVDARRNPAEEPVMDEDEP
jgi:hypothetical protein